MKYSVYRLKIDEFGGNPLIIYPCTVIISKKYLSYVPVLKLLNPE